MPNFGPQQDSNQESKNKISNNKSYGYTIVTLNCHGIDVQLPSLVFYRNIAKGPKRTPTTFLIS